jgi:uncharacterized protein YyaL (SSP411 family)
VSATAKSLPGEFHFSPRPNRAAEIQWREWSPAAFEDAQRQDKPVLLSISAVWCHWCHVMDETTYSSQGVIDVLNRSYIPVRVDNDVRPDINQRYNMGGWPTTAFLTPGGDILTGATYLPPAQMLDALVKIEDYYRSNKPEIVSRVLENKKRAGTAVAASAASLDPGQLDLVLNALEAAYDATYGGFGGAPKFPQTEALQLLGEQAILRESATYGEMLTHTLEKMAGGGTYDHVEGGFFRYSTTQDWSVPHFEKMLEDHAGLVSALALAGMTEVLDRTTGYLDLVLRDPATGLYAGSQDADEHYYSLDADGRRQHEAPFVDRRVFSSWNCALAVAYLESDARLGRPQLKAHAAVLLDRLFRERFDPNSGMSHLDGTGGQLGDQAWSLLAAVRAYSAGLGEAWLERARSLALHLDQQYRDERFGGYFDHSGQDGLGRLTDRVKPLGENATAAIGLLELDVLEGNPDSPYRGRAERALESVAGLPRQYGTMAASYARALDRFQQLPVKLTTGSPELVRAALRAHPYTVVEPSTEERAIVCVGTECLAPITDAEGVEQALRQHARVG